jgi:hypothetical protein
MRTTTQNRAQSTSAEFTTYSYIFANLRSQISSSSTSPCRKARKIAGTETSRKIPGADSIRLTLPGRVEHQKGTRITNGTGLQGIGVIPLKE